MNGPKYGGTEHTPGVNPPDVDDDLKLLWYARVVGILALNTQRPEDLDNAVHQANKVVERLIEDRRQAARSPRSRWGRLARPASPRT